MISLDLRTVLPLARAAFKAGKLQAQTGASFAGAKGSCNYQGPCAIGVALPGNAIAQYMDAFDNSSIENLIERQIIAVPHNQAGDFTALQEAHDDWRMGELSKADFEETLRELEAKYGTAS